ncbi:MAG: hypothetical protein LAO55_13265 [Acidobacteriia bacterium]|nr:hypothetical protein [Terriglobia bacterium]
MNRSSPIGITIANSIFFEVGFLVEPHHASDALSLLNGVSAERNRLNMGDLIAGSGGSLHCSVIGSDLRLRVRRRCPCGGRSVQGRICTISAIVTSRDRTLFQGITSRATPDPFATTTVVAIAF